MNLAQYKINGHLAHDAIVSLSNFTSIEEVVGVAGKSSNPPEETRAWSDAEKRTIDGIAFECDFDADGRARIVRCASDVAAVDVPSEIDGHPVVEIGEHSFSTCYTLERVTLPECVETIGKYAFMNTAIRTFEAPKNLHVIGRNAFYKCTQLKTVVLNDGLAAIGRDAFRESPLIELGIPASVELIGQGAFKDTQLAFSGPCPTLRIDGGNGHYTLEGGALYETLKHGQALLQVLDENLVAYDGVRAIVAVADRAFAGLSRLESVVLPEGTLAIGDAAFKGCGKLRSVSLPETLVSIGRYAFQETALSSLRIPRDLEEVGTAAFYTGGAIARHFKRTIEHVEIADGNGRFFLIDDILCQRDGDGEVVALLYLGKAEHLVIPREVTAIGMYAFLNCKSIRSVDIHDGVSSIDVGGLDTENSITTITYSTYDDAGRLSAQHVVRYPAGHAGRQAAKLTFARGLFDLEYAYAAADDAILATQDTYVRARAILERLRNPIMLDDGMRTELERRIRRGAAATVVSFGKNGFPQGIDMLYEEGVIDADNIDLLIEAASDAHEIAVLSRLMKLKHEAFDAPMFDFDL